MPISARTERTKRIGETSDTYTYSVVEERERGKLALRVRERVGDRGRVWPKLANKTAANIAWGSR